jgi:hypothetical protein
MEANRTAMTITEMRDAGLLRERVAKVYGQALTFGGNPETYFRAMRLVRRLARMTSQSIDTVLTDVRADYAVMEGSL